MKCLYIDASNSGISGDMLLASLLGLMPDSEGLLKELKQIHGKFQSILYEAILKNISMFIRVSLVLLLFR